MSTKYIGWAFEQPIPTGPKFVLVALADTANNDGYSWPGTKKIGDAVSMSRQTVSLHLRKLGELGLVSVLSRTSEYGGGQISNAYQLWMNAKPQVGHQIDGVSVGRNLDTPVGNPDGGGVGNPDGGVSENGTGGVALSEGGASQNPTPPVGNPDALLEEPSCEPSLDPSREPGGDERKTENRKEAEVIWNNALAKVEAQITRPSFKTWLEGTVGLSHDGHDIVVAVPSQNHVNQLMDRMWSLLTQALHDTGPLKHADLTFVFQREGEHA